MALIKIIDPKGWMGHPKGTIIETSNAKAIDLINRNVAKTKVKTKKDKDKMVKTAKTK